MSQKSYIATLAVCATVFLSAPLVKAQFEPHETRDAITAEAFAPLVGGPTLVTLQGKDVPLGTAVKALMDAAQLPLDGVLSQGEETRTVTVNWNKTPFWEAARDLETQTGLQWVNISFGRSDVPLKLTKKANFSSPQGGLVGLSGATTPLVRIVATSVERHTQSMLDLGKPLGMYDVKRSETMTVKVKAYFDPHIRLADNVVNLKITTPQDVQPLTYRYSPLNFLSSKTIAINNFDLSLETQGNPPKIPLLAGSLLADVPVKSEKWELPNVTENTTATRSINGITYKLEDVALDGDQITAKVSTHGTALQIPFNQNATPPRLVDQQGAEVPLKGNGSSMSTHDGEVTCTGSYSYSLRVASKDFPEGEVRPGPFKLVWEISTEIKTLKVPFEFRDVPLP